MKRYNVLTILAFGMALFLSGACSSDNQKVANHNYMWFDCEANYATLSHPDSIRFYLAKCKDLGFDNVVVDVKSIMGEVLYKSDIAPYMGDWEGVERPLDYDMLGYFIEYGHEMGLNVFGSLDILPFTGVTFPFVSNGGTSMIGAWGLLAFVKAADTRQNASFAVRLKKNKEAGV